MTDRLGPRRTSDVGPEAFSKIARAQQPELGRGAAGMEGTDPSGMAIGDDCPPSLDEPAVAASDVTECEETHDRDLYSRGGVQRSELDTRRIN